MSNEATSSETRRAWPPFRELPIGGDKSPQAHSVYMCGLLAVLTPADYELARLAVAVAEASLVSDHVNGNRQLLEARAAYRAARDAKGTVKP